MKLCGYIILLLLIAAVACRLCNAQTIRITSFQATNEKKDSVYSLKKDIVLTYRETHILVTYIDCKDSVKARYDYKLLGFDKRWHTNGKLTAVNYINLLGGDYILLVRNRNFPQNIATLPFHLEEAFWQKPWFVPMIVAYGLLVLGLIVYFIRMYRLQNQVKLDHIRNEIAADLHDDVGTALSSISFLSEMAKARFEKKPEDIQPILERIVNESREIMQIMRGVVWVINPQHDNSIDFFRKVKDFAESALTSKKIALSFVVQNLDARPMGLEVQRNLFLIFKEAIVNIGKHSNATTASVAIRVEKNFMWVRIQDDGDGFDNSLTTDGNGLRNLKNRALQLGGNLEVEARPGVGTLIKMVIPFT